MSLSSGTRLGPYEIVSPLGAGGMGEVYRARDTRLDREVAVKVLPSHTAVDPEARARFEREAKAVAALSHPNILAIHDFGIDAGTVYAATELLHGETLRARLAAVGGSQIPLSVPKALNVAVQLARGLAAAHDRGIIHRDLKPENVFITTDGHAKILDFGLARAVAPQSNDGTSPTSLHATEPGAVMGTAAYMSPEQVKGREADHRADIFALGCVLYEMLGGRRAFQKDTAAETMTAVLREDPPALAGSGGDVPSVLDSIVRHCLEKQPEARFQSARDLTFALESAAGSSSGLAPPTGVRAANGPAAKWPWAVVMLVISAAGLGVLWSMRGSTPPATNAPVIRAELSLPGFTVPSLTGKDDLILALSPDGRQLATVTADHATLLLRNLETGESRVLAQGGEIGEPTFSPEGQFVAFVQGGGGTIRTAVWGAIKKIAVTGGAATVVADGIIGLKGAAWGEDGYIYYSPAPSMGLWRASADHPGLPEELTTPDARQGERTHRRPVVLPGAKALLFTVGSSRITSFDDARIEAITLSDRSRKRLIEGGTSPRYLPTGHLLYERGGQLLAVKFDPNSLAVKGAPVVVADGIANLWFSGTSYHSVSNTGVLVYVPQGPEQRSQVVSVDREGRGVKLADAPALITSGRLSPDGRRLAIDPDGASQQIAIIDLSRNLLQQFTYEWDNANPLWTSDGSRLVFRSNTGGGPRHLYWQAADGSGGPEQLTAGDRDEIPTSILGKLVVYETIDPKTKMDVWVMSLDERKPRPLVQTVFDESGARLSPDGHWLAYQSNQSGRWEVWVQRYPGTGSRQQVSQGGGVRPMWSPDSRSIEFQSGQDVMSASVAPSGVGAPMKLLTLERNDVLLDITGEGRFLVRRTTPPPATSLGVIVNWFDHVRRIADGTGDR